MMAKVVLGLTMSLDGFISDRNGSLTGLYDDFKELLDSESFKESEQTTGAVVLGKRAYAMGDPDDYADNYEFQVPIFVLTKSPPEKSPKENEKLTFTFVTDGIESAIEQAKLAAGDKNVTVIGGANTAQQCIRAGLVDELQIDIMPVLICEGLQLFENLGESLIKLEKIKVIETGARTSLHFRVCK